MDNRRLTRVAAIAAASVSIAACAQQTRVAGDGAIQNVSFTSQDRECMARAMYFESHRGADEGMLAVGTVVANRKDSGRYGASICDVVSQKRAFAPGVMTRSMDGEAADRARRAAETVLSGRRHPGVGRAMFFHTAGYNFRYPNMHYVLVAGGNAFYEKREVQTASEARDNARSKALALAYARIDPTGAAKPIQVASATPMGPVPTIQPSLASQPHVASVVTTMAPTPAPAPAQVRTTVVASAAPVQTAPAVAAPVQTASVAPTALAYAAPARPAVAVPAPVARTAVPVPKPAVQPSTAQPLAVASVERTPPPKRVLSADKLQPVFAAVTPPARTAPAPVEPTTAPQSSAYNGEVAAAFSAFEMR